jgi:hypothetical protein
MAEFLRGLNHDVVHVKRDWPEIERLVAGRIVVATNTKLRTSALPIP